MIRLPHKWEGTANIRLGRTWGAVNVLRLGTVNPYRPLRRALYALIVFAGAYYGVGTYLGFGAPADNESPIGELSRWCERVSDGLLREPANALGNLGFVIAGLVMFFILARDHTTNRYVENEFIGNQPIALLYASAALFLGPGSMLMHGTHTFYGAWADNVSMVAYILVPVLYNLRTLGRWSLKTFFTLYAVIVVAYAAAYWFLGSDLGIGLDLFAVSIPIWLISEAIIRFDATWFRWISGLLGFLVAAAFGTMPADIMADPVSFWWVLLFWVPAAVTRGRSTVLRWYLPWFFVGVASFFGGYMIWLTGTDESAQCDPDTFLQPHALWHILSAAATMAFFLYFRTEEDRGSYIPNEAWNKAS